MSLKELSSEGELRAFLNDNPSCLVTFSAHWCGPCRASKPQLEQLAKASTNVPFGIVYEDTLGDAIHHYRIRAFPTYVLFQNSSETNRIEGANLAAVQAMVESAKPAPLTGGETLGGGSTPMSPEEARAARLATLGGAGAGGAPLPAPAPSPAAAPPAAALTSEPTKEEDVEMTDASPPPDLTAGLDPVALETLESMGFSKLRAQKGLLYSANKTVEGAIEWLSLHQDDEDIDDPIVAAVVEAKSYKCNDCGKTLSNMANLELHANKTGHSDFSESTESVTPLSPEEKLAKIQEIKELLRLKRAEREEAEKVDETEREKQRRMMGKEMHKTREQLDQEQRKRESYLRKKEKEEFKKERQRLREELARDKAERASRGGKLTSRLGVDGYKPDGIQYDAHPDGADAPQPTTTAGPPKAVDFSKIDQYIQKVSSYRAGRDGGACLKILKVYVGNVVDHPDEVKYKTINMDNKAFKTKVKPLVGAKNILLACGFAPDEGGDALVLSDDATNMEVLQATKQKLEAALIAYG